VRIFASVDTFVESTASSLRLGRLVANATFLESLLREGRFDRHVLFCPTEAERSKLQDFLRSRPDGERLLGLCDLRPLWDLPRALREDSFAVLHCGGWSRYLPPLAWLRAQHSPRPVPLTGLIHSINGPDQAVQIRRLVESPLRTCDAVFCTSTEGRVAFANQIARVEERQGLAFQGTLRHVPLGVDERYFQLPDRTQARRRQSIAAHRMVALWIGRLSPASKADLVPLLYQWRLLVDQLDLATLAPLLVLAGGASASDELALRTTIQELKLGESVRLLRDIEDAVKLDLLAAADVFVSPIDNHQETFGIAVVEAMAAGLPVVCSDWDGYRDLVEHEVHGLRVPVFVERPIPEAIELRGLLEPDLAQLSVSQSVSVDPSALGEALAFLMREPAIRSNLGQAARKRARERFSWTAVLEQADSVWKDLAEQARSLPWPPPSAKNPEILDPHDVFANYPTGQFPSDLPLRVSRLGEMVLNGRIPMPATWQDLVPISDGGLMTTLVVDLRGKTATWEDLATHAANKCRKGLPEARAMLAWLVKYGILEEHR
jgi:glycosyltransferase involved in cell wall biosynthesis